MVTAGDQSNKPSLVGGLKHVDYFSEFPCIPTWATTDVLRRLQPPAVCQTNSRVGYQRWFHSDLPRGAKHMT